jgi:transposase
MADRPRRSYTAEQKRQLVEETRQPGASVSVVARRHDVNANLLFTWRRRMRDDRPDPPAAGASERMQFIPLGVIDRDTDKPTTLAEPTSTTGGRAETRPAAQPERTELSRRNCTIEIELPNGVRLRMGDMIEATVLRRIVMVLKVAW